MARSVHAAKVVPVPGLRLGTATPNASRGGGSSFCPIQIRGNKFPLRRCAPCPAGNLFSSGGPCRSPRREALTPFRPLPPSLMWSTSSLCFSHLAMTETGLSLTHSFLWQRQGAALPAAKPHSLAVMGHKPTLAYIPDGIEPPRMQRGLAPSGAYVSASLNRLLTLLIRQSLRFLFSR